ncbi:MAG: MerR family transcriptional regulator [Geminicoccaceae bacterium]
MAEPAPRSELAEQASKQIKPAKSATAFRTISEVANDLQVAQHVLRFWESKFPQVKPLKRGGGRRYYRPEDVDLLKQIRRLLYDEGYTIKGVQKLLKSRRGRDLIIEIEPASADLTQTDGDDSNPKTRLRSLRMALTEIRDLLRSAED